MGEGVGEGEGEGEGRGRDQHLEGGCVEAVESCQPFCGCLQTQRIRDGGGGVCGAGGEKGIGIGGRGGGELNVGTCHKLSVI